MFKPTFAASGVVAIVIGTAGAALAEEPPEARAIEGTYTSDTDVWREANRGVIPAPREAFELTLGGGYTQGFGDLQQDVSVEDTAQVGVSFDLGLGYRISPRWAVGLTGGYQMFDEGDALLNDEMPRGVTGRIDATYHFSPYSRLDPWLKLGTGYRYLAERDQPGGNAHLHGLEVANLNLGFDLRAGRQFALAPLIGGGLNVFLWDGTDAIDDPRPSAFVFAGLQARFDLGGSYERPYTAVASF
jgi:hypothetical protein